MILSIIMNYGYGLWSDKTENNEKKRGMLLTSAIVVNIALLGFFKYANFFVSVMNTALQTNLHLQPIPLPIGISFYTFHTLSYLINIYRKREKAQRNLFSLSLYITFFPQLVAGPIIRYNAISEQLSKTLAYLPWKLVQRSTNRNVFRI